MDTKEEKQRLKKAYAVIEMIEDMYYRNIECMTDLNDKKHALTPKAFERACKNITYQRLALQRLENYYKNLMNESFRNSNSK